MRVLQNYKGWDDDHILMLSRSQGRYGVDTAKAYASLLERRAWNAFERYEFEEALDLAERGYEFCGRAFGLSHERSKVALQYLIALRLAMRASELVSSFNSCVAA